jgi:hypothetical protein
MRAETLHRIVDEVLRDIENTGAEVLLPSLITALEAQIADSDEETQAATAAARKKLESGLANSQFNESPTLDREILVSLGIERLLGDRLAARIGEAFEGNEVTPALALESLKDLNERLQALYKKVYELTEAFEYFEIEQDELQPGAFEVTVAIPGSAIDDELLKLGREAIKLSQIFGVFSEIATGSREPVKVRAIASTDPTFFLDSPAAVAALIATAIERLAAFYLQILTIIKMHRDMKVIDLPDRVLDPLKKHIEKSIGEGIEKTAKSIEKEHFKNIEQGRRQELKMELRSALREIASRLDRGYGFDVRGEDLEQPEIEEGQPPQKPTAAAKVVSDALKIVEEARPKLRHFEPAPEPILGLTPPNNDPTGNSKP